MLFSAWWPFFWSCGKSPLGSFPLLDHSVFNKMLLIATGLPGHKSDSQCKFKLPLWPILAGVMGWWGGRSCKGALSLRRGRGRGSATSREVSVWARKLQQPWVRKRELKKADRRGRQDTAGCGRESGAGCTTRGEEGSQERRGYVCLEVLRDQSRGLCSVTGKQAEQEQSEL